MDMAHDEEQARIAAAARCEELRRAYLLEPHVEGGSFREEYETPSATQNGRRLMGSIYFLLEGADVSRLHVIDCEELWYYHEGCGMRITLIDQDGQVSSVELGPDATAGQRMMVAIPAGIIFGAQNLDESGYTFVSCATSPRFCYEGFKLVGSEKLDELGVELPAEVRRLAYPRHQC